MTPSNPPPVSALVRSQAIQWIVRLRSGDATNIDRDQFKIWLAEHPAHKQEFELLSRMWNTLDQTKPLLQADLDEANRRTYTPHIRLPVWQSIHWPVTVSLILACVALTSWWWLIQAPEAIRYQTAKGEQREIALKDGSRIRLNTETTLAIQESDTHRTVSLDRGEAWFTVSHDEKRPFRVQAGNGAIQDLGTQFIVRRSPQKVQVSVLEGIVAVDLLPSLKRSATSTPRIVEGGKQVWYDADGHLSAIAPFDHTTVGAWKEGKLVFQALPLGQVLTEVARYRSEEIRLLDPNLKQVPVSGVFDIQNLQNFVQALQDALPIRTTWVTPHLVIVEPALARPPQSPLSTRR